MIHLYSRLFIGTKRADGVYTKMKSYMIGVCLPVNNASILEKILRNPSKDILYERMAYYSLAAKHRITMHKILPFPTKYIQRFH